MSVVCTSEAEAANLALSTIGEPPIGTLTDPSSRAKACAKWFATVRDSTLRAHDWNFCSAWVLPAMAVEQALGPNNNRFPLPADCLKVRRVIQPIAQITSNVGISITDPNIIAELESSTPPLPFDWGWDVENPQVGPTDVPPAQMVLVTRMLTPLVNYTRQVTMVRLWQPDFLWAFAEALGAAVAPEVARDINAKAKLEASSADRIDKATRTDSREESPRHVSRNTSWVNARIVGVARSRAWGKDDGPFGDSGA